MENHPTEVNRKSIKRRKLNWIGHTLRKEAGAIEKTALDRNPQGYRRRGRPNRTWRRTLEDEIRSTRRTWNEVKGTAGDRNAWKLSMDALCSTRSKMTLMMMMMMMMIRCATLYLSISRGSYVKRVQPSFWCRVLRHRKGVGTIHK